MRTPVANVRMTRPELEAYAAEKGFTVDTLATTLPEPENPIGYVLRGPRGNKHTLTPGPDGTVRRDEVTLWWDGVEYANRRTQEKRTGRR